MPTHEYPYTDHDRHTLDKRFKLSPEDVANIIHDRKTLNLSMRQLASKYHVSRRRIQQIINPDVAARARELLKKRQATIPRTPELTELHRLYMQRYRIRKRLLNFTSTDPTNYRKNTTELLDEYNTLSDRIKHIRQQMNTNTRIHM